MPSKQKTLNNFKRDDENIQSKLVEKQDRNKKYYDKGTRSQAPFEKDQSVTHRRGNTWKHARIIDKCKEPRSYLIKSEDGTILRRNSSFLRESSNKFVSKSNDACLSDEDEGNSIIEISNDDVDAEVSVYEDASEGELRNSSGNEEISQNGWVNQRQREIQDPPADLQIM